MHVDRLYKAYIHTAKQGHFVLFHVAHRKPVRVVNALISYFVQKFDGEVPRENHVGGKEIFPVHTRCDGVSFVRRQKIGQIRKNILHVVAVQTLQPFFRQKDDAVAERYDRVGINPCRRRVYFRHRKVGLRAECGQPFHAEISENVNVVQKFHDFDYLSSLVVEVDIACAVARHFPVFGVEVGGKPHLVLFSRNGCENSFGMHAHTCHIRRVLDFFQGRAVVCVKESALARREKQILSVIPIARAARFTIFLNVSPTVKTLVS